MQFKSIIFSLLALISFSHAVAIPTPLVFLTPAELSLCIAEAIEFITAFIEIFTETGSLQIAGFELVDYVVCDACYTQALTSVIIAQIVFGDENAPQDFIDSVEDCHA